MKEARFTEGFGYRIKNAVENQEALNTVHMKGQPAGELAGYTSPVEITSEWEQTEGEEVWHCRAKRLWHMDGKYQPKEDNIAFDLFDPSGTGKPSPGIGVKVFAVFRGVWEMVSAGGAAAPSSDKTANVVATCMWGWDYDPELFYEKGDVAASGEEEDDLTGKSAGLFNGIRMGLCKGTSTTPLPVYELVEEEVEGTDEIGEPTFETKKYVRRKFEIETITRPPAASGEEGDEDIVVEEIKHPLYYKEIKPMINDSGWAELGTTLGIQAFKIATYRSPAASGEEGDKDIAEEITPPDGFASVAALYFFLEYVRSQSGKETTLENVDYSDVWETTTDAGKAVKTGMLGIDNRKLPFGYSASDEVTYSDTKKHSCKFPLLIQESEEDGDEEKPKDITINFTCVVPKLPEEISGVVFYGEPDCPLKTFEIENKNVTEIDDDPDIETWLEAKYRYAEIEYENDKPKVDDSDFITNDCEDVAVLGLWKSKSVPQLAVCETLPYGFCIPCSVINCIIRINDVECSPQKTRMRYLLNYTDEGYMPLNADYVPSVICGEEETDES